MKSFGRLLNEQITQAATEFTDQKLRLAYLLSGGDPSVGCFKNFKTPQPYKDPVSGKDALWRVNDQKEHVWVFGDGTFEKRDGATKESKVLEKGNWTCTEDGDKEFIAAVPYADSKRPDETNLWWIRHCVVEDEIGLCVVGDDDNEPAGWQLENVVYWMLWVAPPACR